MAGGAMNSILPRVIQIIVRASGLSPDEPLSADTGLVGSGVSLDSVAVLELLVTLEKEFGIVLDPTELARTHALATAGSLAELIESKIAGGP